MSRELVWLFTFTSVLVPYIAMAQQDSESTDTQRIETEELVLRIPGTWSRLNDNNTILTLLSPMSSDADSFRENIRVKKYPLASGDDLDSILSVQQGSVGNSFKVIGSGVLRSDEPRVVWLATAEKQAVPGERLLAMIDYLMIHQGHVLVLHSMCEANALDQYRPTFDAIARSVRFTQSSSSQEPTAAKATPSKNSRAYEQGSQVGRYTIYALIAAVGVWLIVRVFKFVRK